MNITIFGVLAGQIFRNADCPVGMAGLQCRPGEDWIEGKYPDNKFYIENFTAVPMPEQPSSNHVFSYATKQWIDPRTLNDLKDQKWTEVKASRDAFEFGSFGHGEFQFDCNQISQQRIGQAAQAAMFALSVGAPFSQDWTLKDNSTATFDAQQMINVALAMGQHISQAHSQSRLLRTAIYGATTPEEVQAITW